MNEINILNIPAYQRKKSIEAQSNRIRRLKPTKASRSHDLSLITDIPLHKVPSPTSYEENLLTSTPKSVRKMKTCGRCEGYFENIKVALIEVTSPIRAGEKLIFETTAGLFEEKINSIQIDRKDISLARSGTKIGVKVSMEPKVGGLIYKIIQ